MHHCRGPHGWHARFRGQGLRLTIGRTAVLEALAAAETHLSAEDIFLKVHSAYPGVGLTTVYRTLELLVGMDAVRKFDFGDGRARYELAEGSGGKRHHHHLVCTRCGRIIDYTDFADEERALVSLAQKELSKRFTFKITDHMIQFSGVCERCQGV